jgi:hypothetical protein
MQNAERRNVEDHHATNVESKISNSFALDVGHNEPPFNGVSLPGTRPTKEMFGFGQLRDKSGTTKQQDETSQGDAEDMQESDVEEDAHHAVGNAFNMTHVGMQSVFSRNIGWRDSTFDAFSNSLVATGLCHPTLTARKMLQKRRFDCFKS